MTGASRKRGASSEEYSPEERKATRNLYAGGRGWGPAEKVEEMGAM